MGACSANGSTEGAVGETVAALGRTGTVLHPMNGSVKMFLEGGWTSLVVVCFYVFTCLSSCSRFKLSGIVVVDSCGKHVAMYLFKHHL